MAHSSRIRNNSFKRGREAEINIIQGESRKCSCQIYLFTLMLDIFTRTFYEVTETEIFKVNSRRDLYFVFVNVFSKPCGLNTLSWFNG